jgi:hypothetical protein
MIVKERKFQRGQKQLKKSMPHGGKPTIVVLEHMSQLPERLEKDRLYAVPAYDAENKNLSLTTRITTNLWKLFGFVNLAITKGTKKLIFS